jgi:hypothetical protein
MGVPVIWGMPLADRAGPALLALLSLDVRSGTRARWAKMVSLIGSADWRLSRWHPLAGQLQSPQPTRTETLARYLLRGSNVPAAVLGRRLSFPHTQSDRSLRTQRR